MDPQGSPGLIFYADIFRRQEEVWQLEHTFEEKRNDGKIVFGELLYREISK